MAIFLTTGLVLSALKNHENFFGPYHKNLIEQHVEKTNKNMNTTYSLTHTKKKSNYHNHNHNHNATLPSNKHAHVYYPDAISDQVVTKVLRQ